MNISYLKEHFDELIDNMRFQCYSEHAIAECIRVYENFIISAEYEEWLSFEDAWVAYTEKYPSLSSFTLKNRHRVLKILLRFALYREFPVHQLSPEQLDHKIHSVGALDLSFWQSHLSELLSYMEENGYGVDYRKKISNIANRITVLSRSIAWDSYEEIWQWYNLKVTGKRYLHDVRSILGILSDFHINGIMPNNRATQNPLCLRDNNYSHLLPQYKELVDYATAYEKERGLKESSILRTKDSGASFFNYLQNNGCYSLEDATEELILEYFFCGGKEIRGYVTLSKLRRFLNICSDKYEVCKSVLCYLPNLRNARKTIQYLSPEEVIRFKAAVFDKTNNLTYKDRAIAGFLLYTPMRNSDIISLTLDSFDLRNNTFSFIQEKTASAVTLPITINLGNLVYDYCTNEREDTGSNKLFLSDNPPYNPLGKGGIEWAVSKIMFIAGIRQNKGDRKGTHIFRHRGATTMAQNNVPAPVISAAMGHESPKSLSTYLSADFKHLKICALGLGAYTISEEVFSDV